MAEHRKVKVSVGGTMKDGTEIGFSESKAPWTEIKLEDGAVLRMKNVIFGVYRIDGEFDREGNPMYVIKSSQAISVIDGPADLKKK